MDGRRTFRLHLILAFSSLLALSCKTNEQRRTGPYDSERTRGPIGCSGNSDLCAVYGGVMMIGAIATTRVSPAERKANQNRIGGKCEVIFETDGPETGATPAPAQAPAPTDKSVIKTDFSQKPATSTANTKKVPCDQVLLTITGRDGSERKAWVNGKDFDVPGLGKPPYEIVAESEIYQIRARLKDVKAGTNLQIQLKLQVRRN